MGRDSVLQAYVDLSKIAKANGAQWIIWSEGEYTYPISRRTSRERLKAISDELDCPLLVGTYDIIRGKGSESQFVNSAVHVDPGQGIGNRYDKQLLVPFGEYMPLENRLDFIYNKINWKSRYIHQSSPRTQVLDDINYSFLICYEAIFPQYVRKSIQEGTQLLVNITYDGWFGKSTAPYQHMMLAASRSTEFGVPLIRLSTTGTSTVVNSLGEMADLSPIYEKAVLVFPVHLVKLSSLYARIGDLFAWLCVFVTFLALFYHRFQTYRI
jgi:apolipoprotein N-acyltransferase